MIDVHLEDLKPGDLMYYGFMRGYDDDGREILNEFPRLVLAVTREGDVLHVWWFTYDAQRCLEYIYLIHKMVNIKVRVINRV